MTADRWIVTLRRARARGFHRLVLLAQALDGRARRRDVRAATRRR